MYAKRNYGFWMTLNWSKKPFLLGLAYSSALLVLHKYLLEYLNIDISLPWQPVSTLGVAVAFYLGFKNNASYDRTWEARKIWGAIVNNSRSFGSAASAYVTGENRAELVKELIYRHLAWLTALRHQLRLAREWEHTRERLSAQFASTVCPTYYQSLDKEIFDFIPKHELEAYKNNRNMATQILKKQTERLEELHRQGHLELFKQLELQKYITAFFDEQGKSERIKNFPFPRQYASTALWMTLIFSLLIPFGMFDIMEESDPSRNWLVAPLSAMTIWIFFLMEMIGDYSENPFEGSYNDIPITAISRSIEVDLREMIHDENIPPLLEPTPAGFLL